MSIVLDVLIIGSLLTLGVVGLSRGFQRELVALFGILFGALVTEVGAQNWGYARAIQMERDPQSHDGDDRYWHGAWECCVAGLWRRVIFARS